MNNQIPNFTGKPVKLSHSFWNNQKELLNWRCLRGDCEVAVRRAMAQDLTLSETNHFISTV
jgi:hypothetical protein